MKTDICDSCCLKICVYCLDCIHTGMGGTKDWFRPKTEKNIRLVEKMRKEWLQ